MLGQVRSVPSNNAKMAATITADMKCCHRQVGRPPKNDTNKKQRQQEAYKKRDASRVYLASSYERWKRLGGQLGLKDSSLAWHLMEAHSVNCDECGLCEDNDDDENTMERTKNPSQFFPALVRCIHKLCHRHYSFGDCVQVMGLICLEVDNGKKENYSIKEMVHKPFMLQLAKNNNSTKNMHNDITKTSTIIDNKCSINLNGDIFSDDDDDDAISEHESDDEDAMEMDCQDFKVEKEFMLSESNKDSLTSNILPMDQSTNNENPGEVALNKSSMSEEKDSSFISVGDEEFDVNENNKYNVNLQLVETNITPLKSVSPYHNDRGSEIPADSSKVLSSDGDGLESTQSCSDISSKPSNINTTQTSNIIQSKSENSSSNIYKPSDAIINEELSKPPLVIDLVPQNNSWHDDQDEHVSGQNISSDMRLVSTEREPSHDDRHMMEAEPVHLSSDKSEKLAKLDIEIPPEVTVGLDLSIVKTEQQDSFQSPDTSKNRKRKSAELEVFERDHTSSFSPSSLNGNTRREIVYKVEYEHLEKNPFCDFYELTAHFPNIQQRTFYRWKRKIKDEFIFLEQNPDMTYEEFCKCVSHAKHEVFELWKKLIRGGHRFSTMPLGSSDNSPTQAITKRVEHSTPSGSSLSVLQMYPYMSYQEFSYTQPMISLEVFSSYKQQVLAAISEVEKNPSIEFNDILKQFKFVTEEAFIAWKKYAQLLNAQKMVKPVKEEPSDSQANVFAMQNAMLQQYPAMFLRSAGVAAYNALINQAMVSGNTTGQIYPALMQAAVNQNPNPYLSAHWQHQAARSQTQSSFLSQAQQQLLVDPLNQQSSLSKLQSLTHVLCNNMKDGDMSSMSSTSPDASSPAPSESTLKKQNKNEYLYFIYHQDVTYSEFNQHYPHISNRTFYRWKKEVRDAQSLLSQNPNYNYDDMCTSYPNIPQDIFNGWKVKINQNKGKLSPLKVWRPHDSDNVKSPQNIIKREPNQILKAVLENDNPGDLIRVPQYKPTELRYPLTKTIDDEIKSPVKDHKKVEYKYVQLNPGVPFQLYQNFYPHVSSDTFYGWKRHISDCLNVLYNDPDIMYNKFQEFFHDVSEEVFEKWKSSMKASSNANIIGPSCSSLLDVDQPKTGSSEDDCGEDEEKAFDGRSYSHNKLKKQNRPEYLCLQENPFTDLQEVINAFPGVSKRTLYRWKKEILQAVEFVRGQQEISFQSFTSYFPEVLEENFNRWKQAIMDASSDITEKPHMTNSIDIPEQVNSESLLDNSSKRINTLDSRSTSDTYSIQTDDQDRCSTISNKTEDDHSPQSVDLPRCERREFKFILEHPDIDYDTYRNLYPNVLQFNFYKWRNDVHHWMSIVMSSPHIDYSVFTIYCQDVPEHIFLKWKQSANKILPDSLKASPESSSYHMSCPSFDEKANMARNELNNNEIQNSNLTNSTYYKSLKTFTPRSRKVNLREYHHFLQNPYMTFQELNEMFNTISGRTFYRWKKEVKEKLEYLETNPETDFESFGKLFPDITEDVFTTWKQKAAYNVASKRTPMNSGHWSNVNHHPSAEDPKMATASESSRDSFESHASSRYPFQKEDEEKDDQELLIQTHSPNFSSHKRFLNSSFEKEDKYMKRENGMEPYGDSGNAIQQMLHQYSSNYMKYNMTPNTAMYSTILSASGSPYMINHSNIKPENPGISRSNSSMFPTNVNLPKRTMSSPTAAISPNNPNICDEIYSPKFRKRQREEYCFLQQNPTMDFNEFTSHFPRVSIRTFYRWKKELKDDR